MNSENGELLKAGLNLLVAVITLGLAWFVGNQLSVKWNLIQKRRETETYRASIMIGQLKPGS